MSKFILQIQQLGQPLRRVELVSPLVIGRDTSADIRIQRDQLVSRRHLAVKPTENGVEIEVLGTTNETTLDDEPIVPRTVLLLRVGARLRIGRTLITLGRGTSLDTTRPSPNPRQKSRDRTSTVVVPPQELQVAVDRSNAWLLLKGSSGGRRRSQKISAAEVAVGAASECELPLRHESVSQRHALLRFDGTLWDVRDLGSAAGTWVAGQRIGQAPVLLRRNTLVNFGNVPTVFVCHDPVTALHDAEEELRGLKLLATKKRLSPDDLEQIANRTHGGHGSYLAAVLMHETEVEPSEWIEAIATVRKVPGVLSRLASWLTRNE